MNCRYKAANKKSPAQAKKKADRVQNRFNDPQHPSNRLRQKGSHYM